MRYAPTGCAIEKSFVLCPQHDLHYLFATIEIFHVIQHFPFSTMTDNLLNENILKQIESMIHEYKTSIYLKEMELIVYFVMKSRWKEQLFQPLLSDILFHWHWLCLFGFGLVVSTKSQWSKVI